MSSADVLSPPTSHAAEGRELPLGQELPLAAVFGSLRSDAKKPVAAPSSWRQEAAKANAGVTSMLDLKTEAADVVQLDNYVQPIDRGPAVAEAQRLRRSWQYAVTGKLAAAAALAEVKAEHIKHGGVEGIHAEACKHIEKHSMEDTFYIVDLGNVQRMYKPCKSESFLVVAG